MCFWLLFSCVVNLCVNMFRSAVFPVQDSKASKQTVQCSKNMDMHRQWSLK